MGSKRSRCQKLAVPILEGQKLAFDKTHNRLYLMKREILKFTFSFFLVLNCFTFSFYSSEEFFNNIQIDSFVFFLLQI